MATHSAGISGISGISGFAGITGVAGVALVLLAGSLTGCARQDANADPGPTTSPTSPTSTGTGSRVEAEVVVSQLVDSSPPFATVLEDAHDVLGYTGRLTTVDSSLARSIGPKLESYAESGMVLLAFHTGIGCDTADGVELRRSGDDFSIRYLDVTEREECLVPKSVVSIFALDRGRLPSNPTLQGRDPAPAGVGELVGFEQFGHGGLRTPEVSATEISQPDQAERFFAQFPDGIPELASEVDGARRAPGSRMFAFPVSGCRLDGAVLVVEPEQLAAAPTGGENVRCVVAEHYIAVFTVDADDVPVDARIAENRAEATGSPR